MSEENTFAQRWEKRQQWWDEYQPSKALWLWSCFGSALAAIVVGIFPGGLMTRDSAERLAVEAAITARAQLVTDLCTRTFAKDQDFHARLVRFKEVDELKLSGVLEDGDSIMPASIDVAALAGICAGKQADTMIPPAHISTSTSGSKG